MVSEVAVAVTTTIGLLTEIDFSSIRSSAYSSAFVMYISNPKYMSLAAEQTRKAQFEQHAGVLIN